MRIVVESPSTLGDREMPTARVSPAPSAQSSDQSSIHGVVTTSSRDANHQNNSHNHVSSSRVQPRFSRDVTSSSSSSPSSGVICGERDVIIDASETGVRTSSSTSSTVTATCPSSVEKHLSNGLRHVETVHESSNNSTKGHLESRKQIIRKNGVQLFRQDHSEGQVVVDKMHLMPSSRSTALHKKVVRSSNDTHTGSKPKKGRNLSALIDMSCLSMSPYEKILKSLSGDEVWKKDITLGKRIGFYRFKGDAGTGNFSHVKIGIHCLTKEKVAVKILDKSKLDAKTQRMLSREISSMEKLHHPNLVRLFEVIETFSKVYLVMEYASSGELYQRITQQGRLSEETAKPLFAQIVSAIDHMHYHHIIHRDIKAENVFFSDLKTVKVGDFGFSTEVKTRQDLLNTFCGSPPYAAPELFSDESYIGPLVDVWALGVLLYFMVSGSMPFKAQTVSSLKKLIIEGEYLMPDFISRDCSRVIRGLLQHEPIKRISIQDLRQSKWLEGQAFPSSLPKYKVSSLHSVSLSTQENFDDSNSSSEPPSSASPELLSMDEEEVRSELRHLGITADLLIQNRDTGVRSNVIGTYRILMHRIQCRRIWDESISASSQRRGLLKETTTNVKRREGDKNGHISIPRDHDDQHACDEQPPSSCLPDLRDNDRQKEGNGMIIVTAVDDKKSGKKSSRKNLWKDNRVFVDSEGFFIPNALNLKQNKTKSPCDNNVTTIVHPASQVTDYNNDKNKGSKSIITQNSRDKMHRKEHHHRLHKKKALLPSCILF